MGVGRSTDTSVSPVASDFGFVITREFTPRLRRSLLGRGGNYFSSEGDLSREGVMRPSLFHFGYQNGSSCFVSRIAFTTASRTTPLLSASSAVDSMATTRGLLSRKAREFLISSVLGPTTMSFNERLSRIRCSTISLI